MCKTLANNTYQCTGACAAGTVWGSVVYTSDSNIYAAAKHMGFLPGTFRKVDIPGLSAYIGTTQNGVTTNNYGNFGASYYLIGTNGALSILPIDTQFKTNVDKKLDSLPKIEQQLANLIKQNQKTVSQMQAKMEKRESQLLKIEQQLRLQISQLKKNDKKCDQRSNLQKDLFFGMKQLYCLQMKTFSKNISDLVNPNKFLCSICLTNKRQALVLPCNHAHYCKQCLKKSLEEGKCKVCEVGIQGYMTIKI